MNGKQDDLGIFYFLTYTKSGVLRFLYIYIYMIRIEVEIPRERKGLNYLSKLYEPNGLFD